jgi:hypothetical protein
MSEGKTYTIESAAEAMERVRNEIARAFIGQRSLVDHTLIALLAGGHLLVEGVPGLGKTLLVRAIAQAVGGDCFGVDEFVARPVKLMKQGKKICRGGAQVSCFRKRPDIGEGAGRRFFRPAAGTARAGPLITGGGVKKEIGRLFRIGKSLHPGGSMKPEGCPGGVVAFKLPRGKEALSRRLGIRGIQRP